MSCRDDCRLDVFGVYGGQLEGEPLKPLEIDMTLEFLGRRVGGCTDVHAIGRLVAGVSESGGARGASGT